MALQTSYKILIVDDEIDIIELLSYNLKKENFTVVAAMNGKEAIQIASKMKPDIILMDVMMPEMDGIEACRQIKAIPQLKNTPLIFLTARGEEFSELAGFEAGADDYLPKPFDFKEFLARVKALIKRSNQTILDAQILKFADLEMDLNSSLVSRAGQMIHLTSKEFQLLEYFLRNQEKVISKAEIAENIWEVEDENSSNLIEVYVNYLRKKVDKGFSSKLIHTQFGMGYILRQE